MLDLNKIIKDEGAKVSPVMEIAGTPVYNFSDAQKLNELELTQRKLTGQKIDLTERQITPDGITYTTTGKKNAAINVDQFLNNRYRKVEQTDGKKTTSFYDVVLDNRAIQEQENGLIYSNSVTAYRVGQGEKGELELISVLIVKDEEFVNDFKNRLNNQSSMKIHELISKSQEKVAEYDDLEF
ncbi:hypothetical protein ACYSNR_00955 [Enterococcus sp. LJL128]